MAHLQPGCGWRSVAVVGSPCLAASAGIDPRASRRGGGAADGGGGRRNWHGLGVVRR